MGDERPLIVTGPYFNRVPPWWFKGYRWSRRRADLAEITTVVTHQTATPIGVGDELLRAHAGDRVAARMARLTGSSAKRRGVPYHGLFSPQDDATLLPWHPKFTSAHGHGSNRYSVGWAYIGTFPGDAVSERLADHFGTLLDEWLSMGLGLRFIEAHRQHSDQRGGDPGAELWAPLVEVARSRGIEPRPEHTTGTGLAIPASWTAPE